MTIYQLDNKKPQILSTNNFIAANATIIGEVTIGNNVSIWFGAVVRADLAAIIIGDNSNIQENCALHVDYDFPVNIAENVTIGHGVILHGCSIAENTLIGMSAVVLTGAKIGKNCIIGANALISQHKIIPDNSLVLGSPGKVVRVVTADEIVQIQKAAEHYIGQIDVYKNLREIKTS